LPDFQNLAKIMPNWQRWLQSRFLFFRSTQCCHSVSRKSTRFHDKKHEIHPKNTRLQKQTYTLWKCPEIALQCQPQKLCNPL